MTPLQQIRIDPFTVRIDKPQVPGIGQEHAHVKSPKGEVVVNKDGTQSHKSRGDMRNLTNKAKKYLRRHGFKLSNPALLLMTPEVIEEAECLLSGNCQPPLPNCEI